MDNTPISNQSNNKSIKIKCEGCHKTFTFDENKLKPAPPVFPHPPTLCDECRRKEIINAS